MLLCCIRNIASQMTRAINMHYEHDWQRKRTKYTVPQVDKGTSLHCYYVKMCRTGVTCIFTFLQNSSEGMFLCLPEELYILSAFFVRHIHSVSRHYVTPDCTFKSNQIKLNQISPHVETRYMNNTLWCECPASIIILHGEHCFSDD